MFKEPGCKQNGQTTGLIYSQVLRWWGQTRRKVGTWGAEGGFPHQVSSGKQLCPESLRTGGFHLAENAESRKTMIFLSGKSDRPPTGTQSGDLGQSVSGGSADGAADGPGLCPQSRQSF